jgi:hypothetical protein
MAFIFAGVLGDSSVRMQSSAIAYIESRDISVVLDFSGSMACRRRQNRAAGS